MTDPGDQSRRRQRDELDREQALVDLDESIASREQAISDLEQDRLEVRQHALDEHRSSTRSDDFTELVRIEHQQAELLRAQERRDSRQDQLDDQQAGRDRVQDFLDDQLQSIEDQAPGTAAPRSYDPLRAAQDRVEAALARARSAAERASAAQRRAEAAQRRAERRADPSPEAGSGAGR